MTTRPTDEEISVLIDEVTIYAALAACATSENERASHRNRIEKAKLQLRDAWLAERQAARDGVTEKMVDSAMLAWSGYYCDCNDANVAGNNRDAMQAALQSIAQPVRVPEEKEDLDPVKLHRQGKFATEFERGFNEGWNECREAMLSTSPQPQQAVPPVPEAVCRLGCASYAHCKAKIHGCASECPALSAASAYNGKKDET